MWIYRNSSKEDNFLIKVREHNSSYVTDSELISPLPISALLAHQINSQKLRLSLFKKTNMQVKDTANSNTGT